MAIYRFVSLLLTLGFLSNTVQSLRFDLQSGHTKCISEDIKTHAMTVGKFSIVNPDESQPLPDSHKITVRVCYDSPFLGFSQLPNWVTLGFCLNSKIIGTSFFLAVKRMDFVGVSCDLVYERIFFFFFPFC